MADSPSQPWTNNPNAPKITYDLYFREKATFSGVLIGSILYGMVTILFFKCIAALFNPVYRRGEHIKWGLVSYTAVMFLAVTVLTAIELDVQSISYIDNREFPGFENVFPPGPVGYQEFTNPKAHDVIKNVMFLLNNFLADGFLLYRCYVVYSMNFWVIAFPCLMYLGSLAMGTVLIYQASEPIITSSPWSGFPYFSISLSLNTLLTLMIVIRLIRHARNTRTAMGISGMGGVSKTIITMLVESCALYAVTSLLVIGTWDANNPVGPGFFLSVLPETQVIAPLLIIQRVANKSALTRNTVASGHLSSFRARSRREFTDDSGVLPAENSMSSVDGRGLSSGELGIGVETTIDSYRDQV